MLYKLFLLFCLYLPFQLALNASEGFDLASGRVFALLLGVLWLFKSLAEKRLFIPNKIQTLLLFSFLFLNFLSLVFAQNIDWSYRKLLFLLSFVPLYFVVADIFQDKEKIAKIIRFLVYGAGLISLVGIIQFSLQFFIGVDKTLSLWRIIITPFLGNSFSQAVFENSSWLVGISGHTYMRSIAFFPDPHMFSFYLGMLFSFSVALYLYSRKKIFLLISISILISDLLTFSRGGYVGLLAGFIFTLFYFRKKIISKFSLSKFIAANVLITLIIVAIVIPNPVSQRLFSSFNISEGSNSGRLETWSQSLNVIKNNPLGVGIGNYASEIKPSADYREPIYSHNLYFDIAAETGIINAIIFILLLFFSARSFYKNRMLNFYAYAGILSIIIFSVHSIFETPLYSVHILPLLLIIIALSTARNEAIN